MTKTDKRLVAAIIVTAVLLVAAFLATGLYIVNNRTNTMMVPATTVTATATATQTVTTAAKATVSSNIALLRSAWAGMTDNDKASIRESWTSARTTVSTKAAFVKGFGDSLRETLPTLTDQEIITWLDWTLAN